MGFFRAIGYWFKMILFLGFTVVFVICLITSLITASEGKFKYPWLPPTAVTVIYFIIASKSFPHRHSTPGRKQQIVRHLNDGSDFDIDPPASDRQLAFLVRNKIAFKPGITTSQASNLIGAHIQKQRGE